MKEFIDAVSSFSTDEQDASAEVTSRLRSIDDRNRVLKDLQKKSVKGTGANQKVLVRSHSDRIAYVAYELDGRVLACMAHVSKLLAVPVTSCPAERNWSKWGKVFASNRASLGIKTAHKLIDVAQNDHETGLQHGEDGDAYPDTFLGCIRATEDVVGSNGSLAALQE